MGRSDSLFPDGVMFVRAADRKPSSKPGVFRKALNFIVFSGQWMTWPAGAEFQQAAEQVGLVQQALPGLQGGGLPGG